MQTRSAPSLSLLDGFDRYFVEAVLRIRGIYAEPMASQMQDACSALDSYYNAIVNAPPSERAADENWLDGHTFDSAAAQSAFLFIKFGVVDASRATAQELEAFNSWWLREVLPAAGLSASAA